MPTLQGGSFDLELHEPQQLGHDLSSGNDPIAENAGLL